MFFWFFQVADFSGIGFGRGRRGGSPNFSLPQLFLHFPQTSSFLYVLRIFLYSPQTTDMEWRNQHQTMSNQAQKWVLKGIEILFEIGQFHQQSSFFPKSDHFWIQNVSRSAFHLWPSACNYRWTLHCFGFWWYRGQCVASAEETKNQNDLFILDLRPFYHIASLFIWWAIFLFPAPSPIPIEISWLFHISSTFHWGGVKTYCIEEKTTNQIKTGWCGFKSIASDQCRNWLVKAGFRPFILQCY